MSVTNNQLTLYSAFILPVLISGSAIVLTGCDDSATHSATQRDGTPDALATYSVAYDTIQESKRVLGPAYWRLASARTYAEFESLSGSPLIEVKQLDAIMTIQRQLVELITIIEKEPGTRAAGAADTLVQQNHAFLLGLPDCYGRWLAACQRMHL